MTEPRVRVEHYDARYETLSRDALREIQFARFRSLIEQVGRKNRFYQRKFDQAGLRPEDIRQPEDVYRVPTTTKLEVLEDLREHPPYGHRLQVPPSRLVGIVETSGTTGLGREVYAQTAADLRTYLEMERYGFYWAGVRPGSVVLLTLPISTTAASQWYYQALLGLRAMVLPVGMYDARRKVEYMLRFGCDVLVGSPSYVQRLGAMAEEMGVELGRQIRPKAILVAGEPFTVTWAQQTEARWGSKLFEQYGATQRVMAWTCEHGAIRQGKRGLLHLLPHLCLTEIIDRETGRHVAPGEEGEMVITPLFAEASPLIRFSTNDKVRYLPAEACPCGRPFDGIEAGGVSRYDNMLKIKMVNVWPETIDGVVLEHPLVAEYRGELVIDPSTFREDAIVLVEFRRDVPPERRAVALIEIEEGLLKRTSIRFSAREHTGPTFLAVKDDFVKLKRWTDKRGMRET